MSCHVVSRKYIFLKLFYIFFKKKNKNYKILLEFRFSLLSLFDTTCHVAFCAFRRKKLAHDAKLATPSWFAKICRKSEPRAAIHKDRNNNKKMIIFMTSGKRPELFRETVSSFCANCLDINLIKRWICIDDGTDAETRIKLAEEFPFIEFIYKDPADVGHAKSLNILLPMMAASGEYFVRLEDDWKFIKPGFFISDCIKILDANPSLGQVMFNRNYQQTATENLRGGAPDQIDNLPFLRHEYIIAPEEKEAWFARHGAGPGPSVLLSWPHFSLQPSVTRVAAAAAKFNESSSYFEYQYGLDYMARGWRTAFLADVNCEHTGRKLNDFSGPANAYELLGQEHFGNAPRQGITSYTY